jgi:hypothetical protein
MTSILVEIDGKQIGRLADRLREARGVLAGGASDVRPRGVTGSNYPIVGGLIKTIWEEI